MKRILTILTIVLLAMPAWSQHDRRAHQHHEPQAMPAPRVEYVSLPANPEQMAAIIGYIRGFSFDNDKLKAAELVITLCPIYAHDLARIVRLFSFDDKRVALLKQAYVMCPDKEHFHCAIEELTFSSSKEEMYLFIEKQNRRF